MRAGKHRNLASVNDSDGHRALRTLPHCLDDRLDEPWQHIGAHVGVPKTQYTRGEPVAFAVAIRIAKTLQCAHAAPGGRTPCPSNLTRFRHCQRTGAVQMLR
jgi:hypothetical protein